MQIAAGVAIHFITFTNTFIYVKVYIELAAIATKE
jgi:hypothetical protein